MAKSVYSLVLSQEVVKALDALASSRGSNRSALVNHILAEYLHLPTSESRAEAAIRALLQGAGENGLRVAAQGSGTVTLQTALSYKYNPALQYTVEMRGSGQELGRLKLALRSQNQTVLDRFSLFMELWEALEHRHLPRPPDAAESQKEPRRYRRTLRRPTAEDEAAGRAVAEYICLLDDCLKIYFKNMDDTDAAARKAENRYLQTLRAVDGLDDL